MFIYKKILIIKFALLILILGFSSSCVNTSNLLEVTSSNLHQSKPLTSTLLQIRFNPGKGYRDIVGGQTQIINLKTLEELTLKSASGYNLRLAPGVYAIVDYEIRVNDGRDITTYPLVWEPKDAYWFVVSENKNYFYGTIVFSDHKKIKIRYDTTSIDNLIKNNLKKPLTYKIKPLIIKIQDKLKLKSQYQLTDIDL